MQEQWQINKTVHINIYTNYAWHFDIKKSFSLSLGEYFDSFPIL